MSKTTRSAPYLPIMWDERTKLAIKADFPTELELKRVEDQ